MKTFKFKFTRYITMLLVILNVLINTICYFIILLSNVEMIETRLAVEPTLYFADINAFLCAINILLSVVAAYCITSRHSIYTKLCTKFLHIEVSCIVCCILYLFWFYLPNAGDSVSKTLSLKNSNFNSTLINLGVIPVGGHISVGYQNFVSFYIQLFCGIQIMSILVNFGLAKILHYSSKIPREYERKEAPRIIGARTAGNTSLMQPEFLQAQQIAVAV